MAHGLELRIKDLLQAKYQRNQNENVGKNKILLPGSECNDIDEVALVNLWLNAVRYPENSKMDYFTNLRQTLLFILSSKWPDAKEKYDLLKAFQFHYNKFPSITENCTKVYNGVVQISNDPWKNPYFQWEDLSKQTISYEDPKVHEFFESEPEEVVVARIQTYYNQKKKLAALHLAKLSFLYHSRIKKSLRLDIEDTEGEVGCAENYTKGLASLDWLIFILQKAKSFSYLRDEVCKLTCHEGVHIIRRIRRNPQNRSLSHALIQLLLVRDLMMPSQYCCTKLLFTLYCSMHKEKASSSLTISKSVQNLLAKHAPTSAHFYLFVDVMWTEFGSEFRELYLELYIRGLTADLNHLEAKKISEKAVEHVAQLETHLASVFAKLFSLFHAFHDEAARECMFSAFCLRPTVERLGVLKNLNYSILSRGHKKSSGLETECKCSLRCGGVCRLAISRGNEHPLLSKGIPGISYSLVQDFVSVLESPRSVKFQYNFFNWQNNLQELDQCLAVFTEKYPPGIVRDVKTHYEELSNRLGGGKLKKVQVKPPLITLKRRSMDDTISLGANIEVGFEESLNKKIKVDSMIPKSPEVGSNIHSLQEQYPALDVSRIENVIRQTLPKTLTISKGQSAVYSLDKRNTKAGDLRPLQKNPKFAGLYIDHGPLQKYNRKPAKQLYRDLGPLQKNNPKPAGQLNRDHGPLQKNNPKPAGQLNRDHGPLQKNNPKPAGQLNRDHGPLQKNNPKPAGQLNRDHGQQHSFPPSHQPLQASNVSNSQSRVFLLDKKSDYSAIKNMSREMATPIRTNTDYSQRAYARPRPAEDPMFTSKIISAFQSNKERHQTSDTKANQSNEVGALNLSFSSDRSNSPNTSSNNWFSSSRPSSSFSQNSPTDLSPVHAKSSKTSTSPSEQVRQDRSSVIQHTMQLVKENRLEVSQRITLSDYSSSGRQISDLQEKLTTSLNASKSRIISQQMPAANKLCRLPTPKLSPNKVSMLEIARSVMKTEPDIEGPVPLSMPGMHGQPNPSKQRLSFEPIKFNPYGRPNQPVSRPQTQVSDSSKESSFNSRNQAIPVHIQKKMNLSVILNSRSDSKIQGSITPSSLTPPTFTSNTFAQITNKPAASSSQNLQSHSSVPITFSSSTLHHGVPKMATSSVLTMYSRSSTPNSSIGNTLQKKVSSSSVASSNPNPYVSSTNNFANRSQPQKNAPRSSAVSSHHNILSHSTTTNSLVRSMLNQSTETSSSTQSSSQGLFFHSSTPTDVTSSQKNVLSSSASSSQSGYTHSSALRSDSASKNLHQNNIPNISTASSSRSISGNSQSGFTHSSALRDSASNNLHQNNIPNISAASSSQSISGNSQSGYTHSSALRDSASNNLHQNNVPIFSAASSNRSISGNSQSGYFNSSAMSSSSSNNLHQKNSAAVSSSQSAYSLPSTQNSSSNSTLYQKNVVISSATSNSQSLQSPSASPSFTLYQNSVPSPSATISSRGMQSSPETRFSSSPLSMTTTLNISHATKAIQIADSRSLLKARLTAGESSSVQYHVQATLNNDMKISTSTDSVKLSSSSPNLPCSSTSSDSGSTRHPSSSLSGSTHHLSSSLSGSTRHPSSSLSLHRLPQDSSHSSLSKTCCSPSERNPCESCSTTEENLFYQSHTNKTFLLKDQSKQGIDSKGSVIEHQQEKSKPNACQAASNPTLDFDIACPSCKFVCPFSMMKAHVEKLHPYEDINLNQLLDSNINAGENSPGPSFHFDKFSAVPQDSKHSSPEKYYSDISSNISDKCTAVSTEDENMMNMCFEILNSDQDFSSYVGCEASESKLFQSNDVNLPANPADTVQSRAIKERLPGSHFDTEPVHLLQEQKGQINALKSDTGHLSLATSLFNSEELPQTRADIHPQIMQQRYSERSTEDLRSNVDVNGWVPQVSGQSTPNPNVPDKKNQLNPNSFVRCSECNRKLSSEQALKKHFKKWHPQGTESSSHWSEKLSSRQSFEYNHESKALSGDLSMSQAVESEENSLCKRNSPSNLEEKGMYKQKSGKWFYWVECPYCSKVLSSVYVKTHITKVHHKPTSKSDKYKRVLKPAAKIGKLTHTTISKLPHEDVDSSRTCLTPSDALTDSFLRNPNSFEAEVDKPFTSQSPKSKVDKTSLMPVAMSHIKNEIDILKDSSEKKISEESFERENLSSEEAKVMPSKGVIKIIKRIPKSHTCSTCVKSFAYHKNLVKHFELYHPNEPIPANTVTRFPRNPSKLSIAQSANITNAYENEFDLRKVKNEDLSNESFNCDRPGAFSNDWLNSEHRFPVEMNRSLSEDAGVPDNNSTIKMAPLHQNLSHSSSWELPRSSTPIGSCSTTDTSFMNQSASFPQNTTSALPVSEYPYDPFNREEKNKSIDNILGQYSSSFSDSFSKNSEVMLTDDGRHIMDLNSSKSGQNSTGIDKGGNFDVISELFATIPESLQGDSIQAMSQNDYPTTSASAGENVSSNPMSSFVNNFSGAESTQLNPLMYPVSEIKKISPSDPTNLKPHRYIESPENPVPFNDPSMFTANDGDGSFKNVFNELWKDFGNIDSSVVLNNSLDLKSGNELSTFSSELTNNEGNQSISNIHSGQDLLFSDDHQSTHRIHTENNPSELMYPEFQSANGDVKVSSELQSGLQYDQSFMNPPVLQQSKDNFGLDLPLKAIDIPPTVARDMPNTTWEYDYDSPSVLCSVFSDVKNTSITNNFLMSEMLGSDPQNERLQCTSFDNNQAAYTMDVPEKPGIHLVNPIVCDLSQKAQMDLNSNIQSLAPTEMQSDSFRVSTNLYELGQPQKGCTMSHQSPVRDQSVPRPMKSKSPKHFECLYCPAKVSYKGNLTKHIKTKHPDVSALYFKANKEKIARKGITYSGIRGKKTKSLSKGNTSDMTTQSAIKSAINTSIHPDQPSHLLVEPQKELLDLPLNDAKEKPCDVNGITRPNANVIPALVPIQIFLPKQSSKLPRKTSTKSKKELSISTKRKSALVSENKPECVPISSRRKSVPEQPLDSVKIKQKMMPISNRRTSAPELSPGSIKIKQELSPTSPQEDSATRASPCFTIKQELKDSCTKQKLAKEKLSENTQKLPVSKRRKSSAERMACSAKVKEELVRICNRRRSARETSKLSEEDIPVLPVRTRRKFAVNKTDIGKIKQQKIVPIDSEQTYSTEKSPESAGSHEELQSNTENCCAFDTVENSRKRVTLSGDFHEDEVDCLLNFDDLINEKHTNKMSDIENQSGTCQNFKDFPLEIDMKSCSTNSVEGCAQVLKDGILDKSLPECETKKDNSASETSLDEDIRILMKDCIETVAKYVDLQYSDSCDPEGTELKKFDLVTKPLVVQLKPANKSSGQALKAKQMTLATKKGKRLQKKASICHRSSRPKRKGLISSNKECRFCFKLFRSMRHLSEHLKSHHNIPLLKRKPVASSKAAKKNTGKLSPPNLLPSANSESESDSEICIVFEHLKRKRSQPSRYLDDCITSNNAKSSEKPAPSSKKSLGNSEVKKYNQVVKSKPRALTTEPLSKKARKEVIAANDVSEQSPAVAIPNSLSDQENLIEDNPLLPKCVIKVCKGTQNNVFYQIDNHEAEPLHLSNVKLNTKEQNNHKIGKSKIPFFYRAKRRKKQLFTRLKKRTLQAKSVLPNLNVPIEKKSDSIQDPLQLSLDVITDFSILTLKEPNEIQQFLKSHKQPKLCLVPVTQSLTTSNTESLSLMMNKSGSGMLPVVKLEKLCVENGNFIKLKDLCDSSPSKTSAIDCASVEKLNSNVVNLEVESMDLLTVPTINTDPVDRQKKVTSPIKRQQSNKKLNCVDKSSPKARVRKSIDSPLKSVSLDNCHTPIKSLDVLRNDSCVKIENSVSVVIEKLIIDAENIHTAVVKENTDLQVDQIKRFGLKECCVSLQRMRDYISY